MDQGDKKKEFLSVNSYISVSMISILCLVIVFIMEIKSTANQNKESILALKAEWNNSYLQIKEDVRAVKKEQQFFRESMIQSINEIRKTVYRIDGKLETYDNKQGIKK